MAVRDYKVRIESHAQSPCVWFVLKNGQTSIEVESGTMELKGMQARLELVDRLIAYMHDFGVTSFKIEKL